MLDSHKALFNENINRIEYDSAIFTLHIAILVAESGLVSWSRVVTTTILIKTGTLVSMARRAGQHGAAQRRTG